MPGSNPLCIQGLDCNGNFWLRAPNMNNSNNALAAWPGNNVNNNNVNNDNALVPAWPCCQMADLCRLSRT